VSTPQSAPSLLMVRPTTFGFDKETVSSNAFQHELAISRNTIRERAVAEFDAAVTTLRKYGIHVTIFEDFEAAEKPDAVFPNNWLSMWPDGHIYLYPMAAKSRRKERSNAAVELLKEQFIVNSLTDLSDSEKFGRYLESTGVMIFDHVARVVYGCLSARCDEELFIKHAGELGYSPIVFHAFDTHHVPIYHTNVLMGLQSTTAVVCLEAITDTSECGKLVESLEKTGHEVIAITQAQMQAFCGNVLEIQNDKRELFLALSQTAYDAFTPKQREQLSIDKTLLPLSIPTIETVGGGSVRCMLAEVFLPKR
jgi:hypothetical protein